VSQIELDNNHTEGLARMMVRENKKFQVTRSTTSISFWVIVLLLLVSLLPLNAVWAQDNEPNRPTDDEVNAIASQLYCPVCENVPLDVCGTQACAQWRDLIREKLSEGWSEAQIKEYFSTQYGDRVLAEPPARGLNWLIYVIPPLVFIVGAVFLYRGFISWKKMGEEVDGLETEPDINDEYLNRLEQELKKK
jgi:cytochrome c-type biogenesis protein CcmH